MFKEEYFSLNINSKRLIEATKLGKYKHNRYEIDVSDDETSRLEVDFRRKEISHVEYIFEHHPLVKATILLKQKSNSKVKTNMEEEKSECGKII